MARVLPLLLFIPFAAQAQDVDAGVELDVLLRRLVALEAKVASLEAKPDVDAGIATPVPLDVSQPPFSVHDWTWMNGSNYQPASLLRLGPVTATFFIDADYAWQFSNPVDNTIFPTTSAARHSEFSLNLAYLGPMAGASLTLRAEWTRWLMSTLRGDVFYDRRSAVAFPLPLGPTDFLQWTRRRERRSLLICAPPTIAWSPT